MKPEPYDSLSMRLSNCDVGWIAMDLSTPSAHVSIRLTHVFDPIPDLVSWMEALTTDVMRCGFEIDEEGREKHFVARTMWHGRYDLRISEGEWDGAEEFLHSTIHRRQLIETIYRGLQEFGRSPDYHPEQWGRMTLCESLSALTQASPAEIVSFLGTLDRASLYRFFHTVLPAHYCGLPDRITQAPSLPEILRIALDPDNDLARESISKHPLAWASLQTAEDLNTQITDCLDVTASPFDATPLDRLRSELLETYLASEKDRATL